MYIVSGIIACISALCCSLMSDKDNEHKEKNNEKENTIQKRPVNERIPPIPPRIKTNLKNHNKNSQELVICNGVSHIIRLKVLDVTPCTDNSCPITESIVTSTTLDARKVAATSSQSNNLRNRRSEEENYTDETQYANLPTYSCHNSRLKRNRRKKFRKYFKCLDNNITV